ncbi:MAG: DNA polymerase III subunit delta [Bacillota bacterium]
MKEYKAKWKNKEFDLCYLFYGVEPFLIKNYEKTLTDAILTKEEMEMNYDVLEGSAISGEAIVSIAETYPFFAEKRLVVVRNSRLFTKNAKEKDVEELKPLLKNLPESACLLFIEEKVEKTTALYKQIAKTGCVLEFKKVDESTLRKWIKKEIEKQKFKIEMSAISYFIQNISQDMTFIESEMQKLMSYKTGSDEITIADIKEICSPSVEVRIFDIVNAVAEGKGNVASTIYRELLAQKESPYKILNLITQQYRKMLLSHLLTEEGLRLPEVAKIMEIKEFAVKQSLKQASIFKQESLEKGLTECLELDLKIKTGQLQEETAVELFIIKHSFGI